jgi:hypothetical protein
MMMLVAALSVLVQDQVDNPEYKGWAAFKPGSSVTYKVRIGENVAGDQTLTLRSVGADELVLSAEMSAAPGRAMERKVPAKVPADKAPKNMKEGQEEIEAGGKTLKCATREFEVTTANNKKIQMKVWINDDVPGKAARTDVTQEGGPKMSMVASSWEKK